MVFDLQKASLWKRISAFLFDGILFCVVAVLFALILSGVLGYDQYRNALLERYEFYSLEYGVHLNPTDDEYEAMSEKDMQQLQAAFDALRQDAAAVRALRMTQQLSLLILSLSLLLACLTMEFFLPLALKNGQTLGKKIFGLGVMRVDGVKISTVALFVRSILGKYTLEIMIPVLILLMIYLGAIGSLGLILLGLILLLNAGLLLFTRLRSPLHDLMAGTVVIDLPSQMIFDSPEAMIAYKEKIHAEMAAKETY